MTTPLPTSLTGGCQCGACRYEIAGPPLFGYVCHCHGCRRQSGGLLSASVIVAADAVSATGPIATWFRETADDPPLEAELCSVCGVRLFHHAVPREPITRVKVGTLDDSDWFQPAAEFFTKRRFDWLRVDGDPIQCFEQAEDRGALLAEWQRLFGPADAG